MHQQVRKYCCLRTGHTHAVDWWMLGVLVFEFMPETQTACCRQASVTRTRLSAGPVQLPSKRAVSYAVTVLVLDLMVLFGRPPTDQGRIRCRSMQRSCFALSGFNSEAADLFSGRHVSSDLRKGINSVKFPPQLSPQCVDLIKAGRALHGRLQRLHHPHCRQFAKRSRQTDCQCFPVAPRT